MGLGRWLGKPHHLRKETTMATKLRTFGWSTWVVILAVVMLILIAGLLYLES